MDVLDLDAVEVCADRLSGGDLGHRAVERAVPGLVLPGVTRLAGLRGDVAILTDLDGAVGDLRLGCRCPTRHGRRNTEDRGGQEHRDERERSQGHAP